MSVHDLSLRLADRPLVQKIRMHSRPAPIYETVVVAPESDDDRLVRLAFALAPMAFAFFYLALMTLMLFR